MASMAAEISGLNTLASERFGAGNGSPCKPVARSGSGDAGDATVATLALEAALARGSGRGRWADLGGRSGTAAGREPTCC